jgi:hypothetical protein
MSNALSQTTTAYPELGRAVVTPAERSTAQLVLRAINPAARRALLMQGVLIGLTLPLYPLTHISIAWTTFASSAFLLCVLGLVWVYYVLAPAKRLRVPADALLATLLIVALSNIAGPAQYPAVKLRFPEIDSWLAAADASLGIHVPSLTAWTVGHPVAARILLAGYVSLLPQFVVALVVLGFFLRDRLALWEYVFHFHFCLLVTLVCVGLWPAAHVFRYYHFDSLVDWSRLIQQYDALRAGTFTEVRFHEIEGIISFPSFHAAGALMVTWAFRRHRYWCAVLGTLNALLIAATVLTGAHYAVDVLATFALFAGSVCLWRAWGQRGLIAGADPPNPRLTVMTDL